ncbi:hypothetical protein [Pseudodesulfovibrio portus]|uniref:Uncharacterized protein n=1 Tax=Pseudodesulfovibrio portus TaxID=231439 RepID=A0ABN6RWM6_9BACT|nr:hypothetical protein [Pseudodesulfovibrio portus]BDQ35442.1 hypothetical protein JCM14722_29840 [Pseudodesulfovibrio portus]
MSMSHVVSGLVKKKSALLGEADHIKTQLKALNKQSGTTSLGKGLEPPLRGMRLPPFELGQRFL